MFSSDALTISKNLLWPFPDTPGDSSNHFRLRGADCDRAAVLKHEGFRGICHIIDPPILWHIYFRLKYHIQDTTFIKKRKDQNGSAVPQFSMKKACPETGQAFSVLSG
jgi:hypothetical protein